MKLQSSFAAVKECIKEDFWLKYDHLDKMEEKSCLIQFLPLGGHIGWP